MATARPTDPEKALVEVLDRSGEPLDPPQRLTVSFYPTEYRVESRTRYESAPRPGRTDPRTQFVGGDPDTLSMELVFDTYELGKDVRREYLDRFDRLLRTDEEGAAPPLCRVSWGSLDFTGVLVSATRRFTLFARDGTPLRARVEVQFRRVTTREAPPAEASAPTEQRRTRVVERGDTLWAIAGQEYGDPTEWRTIADANGVEDPRTLQVGTELVVPPRGEG
jgi:hypothetical protein